MSDEPRITTDLGMEVPVPPKLAHRPHTGSRFWAEHPEAKAVAIEMIKEGHSLSDVAEQLGPMCAKSTPKGKDNGIRKHLQALVVLEKIDMAEISRFRFGLVRNEAAERMLEVVPTATKKELGALAMTANMAHQIERTLSGEADVVVEHRITGLPAFAQLQEEARQAVLAAESTGTVLDAEILAPVEPPAKTPAEK